MRGAGERRSGEVGENEVRLGQLGCERCEEAGQSDGVWHEEGKGRGGW